MIPQNPKEFVSCREKKVRASGYTVVSTLFIVPAEEGPELGQLRLSSRGEGRTQEKGVSGHCEHSIPGKERLERSFM